MSIIDTKNIRSYQLLQLLHLLFQQFNEAVLFHSAPYFGFPASDIFNFIEEKNRKILEINVFGLFGIDSPLPTYMNLIHTDEEHHTWYNFLNLFNHIFYKSLYLLWVKHHPILSIQNKDFWHSTCLKALSVFSLNNTQLHLTQFFCNTIKNRHDLRQLLCHTLKETNIEIEEWIPSWQPLSHSTRLDGTCDLGNNTVLGNRVLAVTTTINIHITVHNIKKAKQLFKGKPLYSKLVECLQRFLSPIFAYRISITCHIEQARIPKLNYTHLDGLTRSNTYIINP